MHDAQAFSQELERLLDVHPSYSGAISSFNFPHLVLHLTAISEVVYVTLHHGHFKNELDVSNRIYQNENSSN